MFNLKQFAPMMERVYQSLYNSKIYDKAKIASFVVLGTIDAAAYKRITGEEYEASTENSK
ncbi:XkdX family protein [Lactobacillus sp. ESL0731]|uniref:XkdX family protein n=1 Tax=unclassified Lactobacillus TaxID=2620435 RepID=UPI0023F8215C|nr:MULTISPECIES: XkdX family protein [unclassified Lactobacillus]WEV51689.1 XkdX family protein [Lactobacillus sp. ESL0700]WEV62818.1 XkdX family protein [Lactobacillus sp. ESL0731]